MHPHVAMMVYALADELGRELTPDEIRDAFFEKFVNLSEPLDLLDYELDHHAGKKGEVACHADISMAGEVQKISGLGNGPINAFVHALEQAGLKTFTLTDYRSHAVRGGSDADSAAYIQLQNTDDQNLVWGCGVDPSIEMAGLKALVSAANLLNARQG